MPLLATLEETLREIVGALVLLFVLFGSTAGRWIRRFLDEAVERRARQDEPPDAPVEPRERPRRSLRSGREPEPGPVPLEWFGETAEIVEDEEEVVPVPVPVRPAEPRVGPGLGGASAAFAELAGFETEDLFDEVEAERDALGDLGEAIVDDERTAPVRPATLFARSGRDRDALRRAFLWSEVLAPPLALRPDDRPGSRL